MQEIILNNVLLRLRAHLESDDYNGAINVLQALHTPDQADLFAELDTADQATLLPLFAPEESADILEELTDETAARLVTGLSPEAATRIVDEMEPDEAADLLAELDEQQVAAMLSRLEDPEEIRPLLLHPEDTAGGLMTSSFVALRRRMTAAEALTAIQSFKPDSEEIYQFPVVDRIGKLVGVVSLRQLLQSEPETRLLDILEPNAIAAPVDVDQEECARLMSRYDLLALPVIDDEGLLVGVITVDDIVDVLVDEATEDIQRLGASEPLEQPYLDTNTMTVVRKRIGWLLLLFLTETLTGSVLRHFEDQLQAAVSLAFFIPLLIGTGGNAGSQTSSTIIRALAIGELDKKSAWRPLWHELRVGLVLGLGMAAVAYGRALLWGTTSTVALTVSVAIFTIVVWANCLGSLLPLIANRLHIDPTVVSGPAMSTLVDATGLFIYFTIAGILLGL